MNILQAFGRIEGFDADAANRPTRDHNPGDIEWGLFARAHGATRPQIMRDGSAGRFAFFPKPEQGWAALDALLRTGFYRLAAMEQAINHYAPPCENNTANYVELVREWVGCAPSSSLANLLLFVHPPQPKVW